MDARLHSIELPPGQRKLAPSASARSQRWLTNAARLCFVAIAAGQALFIAFILAFYYPATLGGRFAEWNSKPLIIGFVHGDTAGNMFFAVHVLLAAVITAGGLAQLIPAIRTHVPAFHRWNGRLYMLTALLLAFGGLWLVWVRGTYLNLIGAAGITLDAILIVLFAGLAWSQARGRRFAAHRRWALRLFAVVSAVWYMRIGYMVWGMLSGGAGIGKAMDGPFDYFLAFGSSLVPLAITELYLRAQTQKVLGARYGAAALLTLCAALIAGGSIGAWLMMWSLHI